ncbi:protein transport protein Sec31B [Sorex fumeus]|uniref:protein transport protein Sec31B n=1 Tax=Sorex fumeus TaxID=62283 RepID=UPI0024ACF658|nr:protein transport protein Sec31B [Sorex fumeus]
MTMKLKELERPAVQAWSPANQYPVYLATGTSAQQLDASFSTNGTLELFEIDFRDPSLDLKRKGVLSASCRFHKLVWGSFGNGLLEGSGVLVGGGDNGTLTVYRVAHILSGGKEPVLAQTQKHTGPVGALDFNPFQANLLASGASDSEIFIWDLNHLSAPMTPGSKSQPPEDVKALSWNRQVQHILSSAHPSGKAVVWDLRKNEPIIKVSDPSSRMRCSGLAWRPDVATQLVLCSEDDRLPVIQLWDLRFASSPLKVLESHSRGVLSVSWSQADAELLLSSAKDNQILCWNLGSGDVVYWLPTQSSWCFDVQWCPRDPSVFSATSFDGWIALCSVMGQSWEAQQMRQAEQISASFGEGQPLPSLQVPERLAPASLIPPLKKAPKWMRRPAGGSFAFGGKLVTFGLPSTPAPQGPQPGPRLVFISQVTTEPEFLQRAAELRQALGTGTLPSFCQNKIQQAHGDGEKLLWQFLKVTSEQDAKTKFLKLLGYSKEELQEKVTAWLKRDTLPDESVVPKGDAPAGTRQQLFCRQAPNPPLEGASASSAFFDELVPQSLTPWEIPVTEDADGLLCRAILLGQLEAAVKLCLKEERFADAILLAQAGSTDLLKRTQEHYLAKRRTRVSSLLACVVQKNWKSLVCACSLKNWREALAMLLTYSAPEELPGLCDMLGMRLEQEGSGALAADARLCYVCSGSVERLVECWAKGDPAPSPMTLQDLMEKVMVLQRSLQLLRGPEGGSLGPATISSITQYANFLAAQGSLAAALSYLPRDSAQPPIQQLRDRLFHAQGSSVLGQQAPPFPFPRVFVGAPPRPKDTASYRPGFQPSHQVPAPPPHPRIFTPQSPLVMPFTPSGPNPYQGPRMQNINDYRPPMPETPQSLPLGPGVSSAIPQPPLMGQEAQAPHPGGVTGRWPLSAAPPAILQPGPASLPDTPILFPPLPVRPLGPSPDSPQPGLHPPGGPAVPSFSVLPTAGIAAPLPGSQDSLKNAPAPKGSLWRKQLPETFVPPAPITAPVQSLPPEPRGSLSSQRPIPVGGHAPPGAPRERSLQPQAPKKTEKKELPTEHQPLKTSFETLLQRCSACATDLKTKRKLEEAAHRLEGLYEKLCEGTLSPQVLAGLHEVARCVDTGSFEQGLAVHAQVVGCSTFSEVSGFMPILKAVLTIAHKLHL